MTDRPDGWDIPCHRSLTEPILVGGVPKTVAQALWLVGLSVAFSLQQLWILPIFLLVHLGFVAVTRWDPQFFEMFYRTYKAPNRLDP